MAHTAKLLEILVVNFALSGDNALVIALSTLRLDAGRRRAAILWGTLFSILLRLALTLLAWRLFHIPYIEALGGILLTYLALSLLYDVPGSARAPSPGALPRAIFAIVMADTTMSLDNVVALAGVAGDDRFLLAVGLVVSISLIMFASAVMARVIARFRFLQIMGSGVLAWTAGGMIGHDPGLADGFAVNPLAFVLLCAGLVGTLYGAVRVVRRSG
jgi:YjbE family integral membrane protein